MNRAPRAHRTIHSTWSHASCPRRETCRGVYLPSISYVVLLARFGRYSCRQRLVQLARPVRIGRSTSRALTLSPRGDIDTVTIFPPPCISHITHPFGQLHVASAIRSTRALRRHRTSSPANAQVFSPPRNLPISNLALCIHPLITCCMNWVCVYSLKLNIDYFISHTLALQGDFLLNRIYECQMKHN